MNSTNETKRHVLLVSCIDKRLTDDMVNYMHSLGHKDTYDHFILAGCSLGAHKNPHWDAVLFEHIRLAWDLHKIEEVYLMEHRNCGAYEKYLGADGTFDTTPESMAKEMKTHTQYASTLADRIEDWCKEHGLNISVHCFLMDVGDNEGKVDPIIRSIVPQ